MLARCLQPPLANGGDSGGRVGGGGGRDGMGWDGKLGVVKAVPLHDASSRLPPKDFGDDDGGREAGGGGQRGGNGRASGLLIVSRALPAEKKTLFRYRPAMVAVCQGGKILDARS